MSPHSVEAASMLFDGWSSIGRVLLAGVCAYTILVALLRSSGKRTLAKLNAFDLVVTVALGSTLSAILTSQRLSLAAGVTALVTLVGLQWVVAWTAVRWKRFDRVVKSAPRVLFHSGRFERQAMRDERVTEEEIRAAVRQAALQGLEEVESVVLESSGDLSVVARRQLTLPAGR